MKQILAFNESDMDVVVQPGLNWVELNQELRKMGSRLFFPIDPGMFGGTSVQEELTA